MDPTPPLRSPSLRTLGKAPPPSFKMQPTPIMATAASTAATVALTSRWDNATGSPTAEPDPILDNSVLLVVVMSLFVGGTLVVLSGVLLLCKRCWEAHRRFNRATEEAEKTTTTYLDNGAHPAQDPDFRGEDPEGQDAETERFLSTSSTGRRVSFNEAALFEQSRKSQDKGRRYTLTEGDFHHLKNARLTHLHLPPLKIITIHECDLGEASATTPLHAATAPKANLAIFQPPGKALTGRSVGPSSALPGDPYNSAVGPADFEISPLASSDSGEGTWVRAPERPLPSLPHSRTQSDAGTGSTKPVGPGATTGPGEAGPGSGAGPVLQFFTRLRRHASLDGASPYFKVKKWKLDPSQRASSLDTRGSPKRHHFQRQRAASESTEQEEGDAPHMDFIQYIASAGDTVAFPPPHPFLASPTSPSPTLGRLETAEDVGATGGASPESPPERSGGAGPEQQQESDGERDSGPEQAQTIYRDIWSLRASLELHAAAASDHSSSGNDRDSVRSGDSSGSGSGTTVPTFPPPSPPPTPRSAESEAGGPRKLLQMDSGYASIEGRGAGEDGLPSAFEKRSSFTSAGHTATVGSSFEGALAPTEAPARPRSPRAWPRRAPRRDYSIDEKTDALFHEFLRHDPHFDDALPCASRHRARAHPHPHVRKQWQQRGRQHSDPGARAATLAPPAPPFGPDSRPTRAPLRRGDSVDCPPEGRTGDDPAAPAIPVIEEEPGGGSGGCPGSGLCVGTPGTLLDKLAAGIEDRLFPPRLAQPIAAAPALAAAAAAPTSPDHSPA
ncbi:voltage-dependent calcium channel beta subunit-associated regulatory protein isoform X2 [Ursus americanus]|nr:voltage-dependent calcium channel beta subunit-associated regulatory protein isoform X2 [Ursus americanus]XP_045656163.1 voltage-dependent calcium channel beta subunit-associated regulatory protein isoform X2 [Ursus americanus]XP_045656164.1 voltage-dependent calcium channel beta subunit-associated regulatory protein isoform X2 [Ursus americanus]